MAQLVREIEEEGEKKRDGNPVAGVEKILRQNPYEPPTRPPLETDRWVASSALQKAVRRGEVAVAQSAALTLLQLDRQALWRRLVGIAVEDVAARPPEPIATVMAGAESSLWRRHHGGDARVALLLRRHGIDRVRPLAGGVQGWQRYRSAAAPNGHSS